ncbi:MAG: hypothetical protein V7K68_27805 [Nostoc sp.]|uniref:hypothetical protein n=1 Tax=Nostoc sp. TaxID=1180 RepID=UPI002FFCD188
MNTRSTEMRRHSGILLAENTKMNKLSLEMRKQYVFLLAESTEMSARFTEMRKHLSKMRKQYTFLLINLAYSYFQVNRPRGRGTALLIGVNLT